MKPHNRDAIDPVIMSYPKELVQAHERGLQDLEVEWEMHERRRRALKSGGKFLTVSLAGALTLYAVMYGAKMAGSYIKSELNERVVERENYMFGFSHNIY